MENNFSEEEKAKVEDWLPNCDIVWGGNCTILDKEYTPLDTIIYLTSIELTEVPSCIGNLSNLELLQLIENQLTSLPESIGNLSNLGLLRLQGNQLTSLGYK